MKFTVRDNSWCSQYTHRNTPGLGHRVLTLWEARRSPFTFRTIFMRKFTGRNWTRCEKKQRAVLVDLLALDWWLPQVRAKNQTNQRILIVRWASQSACVFHGSSHLNIRFNYTHTGRMRLCRNHAVRASRRRAASALSLRMLSTRESLGSSYTFIMMNIELYKFMNSQSWQ